MTLDELLLFLVYLLAVARAAAIHLKWPDAFKLSFEERAREDAFNLTNPRDNPYAVIVVGLLDDVPVGTCSGTLLTRQWVLTAAHCIFSDKGDKLDGFLVYAGGVSLRELIRRTLREGAQVMYSARSEVHPEYKKDWVGHDVALIKVVGHFKLTETVNTIEISTQPWTREGFVKCSVTGFGIVQEDEINNKLDYRRKSQIFQIKKPCVCEDRLVWLLNTRRVQNWVCSKPVEDVGLCSGDSGSGLVCDGRLEAVASAIIEAKNVNSCEFFLVEDHAKLKCGSSNTISVFTGLCRQLGWLHSVMKTDSSAVSSVCMAPDTSAGLPHTAHNILLVVLSVAINVLFY